MIGLIYFGRLDEEKGIPGIIEMVNLFGKENNELPFDLFIFGSGTYESNLRSLSQKYKQIHFFGRQNMDVIKKYASMCKYSLMPSECLESFGLGALTSLNRGIPVIGYCKGGLEPFIYPELDLLPCEGKNTGEKLYHKINNLIKNPPKLEKNPRSIAQDYTINHWKENISYLIGSTPQKILIVSDFINKIGGIETYINDCKSILENMGHTVELFGAKAPKGKFGKLFKMFGIFLALFNIIEANRLEKKINRFNPDILRYNSILRNIGRMGINQGDDKIKKILMFHDLGHVYPFPSKLENTNQIPKKLKLIKFLRASKSKNPLVLFALILKYLSLKLIKKNLNKNIDIFMVPSPFMKEIFTETYNIPKEKLYLLPHFIQS